MITLFSRQRASALALGIALATGTATVATAVFPTEASAQRKRDREQSEGGGYSAEFRSVYQPLEEAVKDQATDLTPYRAQFEQLSTMLNTKDEQYAGGSMIFNAGIRTQDQALQLTGMEAMIASGQVPVEQTGRYNFIAYQLANANGDLAKARQYLQGAINYNFTTESIDAAGLQITLAENYFSAGEFTEGFAAFENAISMKKSRNEQVDEQWYRRGVSVAYNNELPQKVYDVAFMWLADYPNAFTWRETINLTRNLNNSADSRFSDAEILDLLRLSRLVGVLEDEADYEYYIAALDARLMVQEVRDVVAEGKASGAIPDDNLYIAEALRTANANYADERAALPELEADAMAPDASLRLLTSAGDAFLNFGEFEKAAGFYERALTMPGVETNEELTRLGIAQTRAENYDAARETFAKVSGKRAPIARLWVAYIDEQTRVEAPSLSDVLG